MASPRWRYMRCLFFNEEEELQFLVSVRPHSIVIAKAYTVGDLGSNPHSTTYWLWDPKKIFNLSEPQFLHL